MSGSAGSIVKSWEISFVVAFQMYRSLSRATASRLLRDQSIRFRSKYQDRVILSDLTFAKTSVFLGGLRSYYILIDSLWCADHE